MGMAALSFIHEREQEEEEWIEGDSKIFEIIFQVASKRKVKHCIQKVASMRVKSRKSWPEYVYRDRLKGGP